MQTPRILIYIILGAVALLIVLHFIDTRSNLRAMSKLLKESQKDLSKALNEVDSARQELSSVQNDMIKFREYTEEIKNRVYVIDMDKRKAENKSDQEKKVLNQNLQKLKELLDKEDSLGYKHIEITDN
jgi:septal ring factor EnvC (AmiA/AmiB activator)